MTDPDNTSSPERTLQHFADEIVETYLALKRFGEQIGLVHEVGNNISTVLSLLLEHGELTVSDTARICNVSRQYALKLARQLEAENVVRLAQKQGGRGYTMQLTPKGSEQVRARAALFRENLRSRANGLELPL